MIVMVLENPEPNNPIRKGVDIEVRLLLKGATVEEGDRIGEVLREAAEELRPGIKPVAFLMDSREVVA